MRRLVIGAAAMAAALSVGMPSAGGVGTPSGRPLEISVGAGGTVVSGTGCNWPEGESYGPGSSVGVTVTTWFAGPGRSSTPVKLGAARIVPSPAGGWEYAVPRAPLAAVPAWATEVVVGAVAHCSQAIGPGFDYDPTEARRAVVRPPATVTTTTPDRQPTTTQPTPAEPIAGTATFTG